MNKQVLFVCETCEHHNKQYSGTANYQERKIIFDSLTEAWEHINHSYNDSDDLPHLVLTFLNE